MSVLLVRSNHATSSPRLFRTSKTVYTADSSSISWKMKVSRFLSSLAKSNKELPGFQLATNRSHSTIAFARVLAKEIVIRMRQV